MSVADSSGSIPHTLSLFNKFYHEFSRPRYDIAFVLLLLCSEAILTSFIVHKIPYTEIDWVAYMQEVTTYQEGERNYINIRGDTGPLVYPAGFLYLYGWLKSLAIGNQGENSSSTEKLVRSISSEAILRIQWVFVAFYLLNCTVVLGLYQSVLRRVRHKWHLQHDQSTPALVVWYWRVAMGITCLSKRIHSIFVLRLFNDAPAMVLLYISMYLFACCDSWSLGCLVFSLAVSIKMNVLLFAPGLLLLLLQKNRSIWGTLWHLSICAAVQLILGWPFLSKYPVSYLRKAFELDRVFFFKWTVNWKFIPEQVFISKPWALLLLGCHLGVLAFLAKRWQRASIMQKATTMTREWMQNTYVGTCNKLKLSPEYVMFTMFVSNFVGIAFARTLHYQFYCWYFHSLPMMHWITTMKYSSDSTVLRVALILNTVFILAVEYAFNVYPATKFSSAMLQISHAFLLLRILQSDVPTMIVHDGITKGAKQR